MRKLLYTTTALVGAAFLMEAAPAKAEVNLAARYNASIVSSGDMDNPAPGYTNEGRESGDLRSWRMSDGARVDFSASKDHPNGLTTGFFSRMGINNAASFDDTYGTIGGSFGTIYLGNVGDAGDHVHVGGTPGTTHFGVGEGGIFAVPMKFIQLDGIGTGVGTSAVNSITGRQQSIKYASPSFSGFSFAASYAPETGKLDGGDGFDDQGEYNDAFALGVAYSNSFAGTSLSISAGYGQTDSEPADYQKPGTASAFVGKKYATEGKQGKEGFEGIDDKRVTGDVADAVVRTDTLNTAVKAPEKETDKDGSAFAFGAEIGYQDFKFGASYGQWERGKDEVTSWRLGGSYNVDAFTFGIGYGQKEVTKGGYVLNALTRSGTDVATGGISYNDKAVVNADVSHLAFTVDYALGDGANIDFGISSVEVEQKDFKGAQEVKADGTGFGMGVTLSF